MKSIVVVGLMVASGLAQMIQFTNTSFAGPFMVGQTASLMWTEGNGLPISLSIANATWNYKIFGEFNNNYSVTVTAEVYTNDDPSDNRAVLPTNYSWVVTALPGLASGNYQLSLAQLNGGVTTSPVFGLIIPDGSNATKSAPPAPTATVTYVYYDDECGCTKTGQANTAAPVTMTQWWDTECGCHMSTMVPITTLSPAANNYTVPSVPPPVTTPAVQATGSQSSVTKSSPSATFTGGVGRTQGSLLGMVAFLVAVVAM